MPEQNLRHAADALGVKRELGKRQMPQAIAKHLQNGGISGANGVLSRMDRGTFR